MINTPLIDTASKTELLASYGGILPLEQFAISVGLTSQDVSRMVSDGDLLCFR